eukprot:jgi/Undpi1/10688/HiC_scaffold_29.g13136.m1
MVSRGKCLWGHNSDISSSITVNLRQCNIGRLEETALAVSDLESPLYGHHLKAAEVCDIVSCPDRAEAVRGVLEWVLGPTMAGEALEWEEGEWLWLVAMDANGDVTDVMDDVLVKVSCSHVAFSMPHVAAAATFPEASFRSHHRIDDSENRGIGGVLRATGDVLIPEALTRHVEFISGLTELWVPGRYRVTPRELDGAGVERGRGKGRGRGRGSFAGMEDGDFTEVMINPRTLRTLYNVPEGERGGWAGRGNNRQGVAAFDDFYVDADLCAAHNLLSPDTDWLNPPDITAIGPAFDPAADEVESDLDTQYLAMMAPGVPVTFSNHAEGQWILEWAQEASEGELTPEAGGPLVWSVSYGFPEEWQCYVDEHLCLGGVHGYNPSVYLHRANVELAKLAALGVSVLVASGDDGAGQFPTCPVDPRLPVDIMGGAVEGSETSCPFEDREDCKCASFSLEVAGNDTTPALRCILPLGLALSGSGIQAPGLDCLEVLTEPDCVDLIVKIENGTTLSQPPAAAVSASAASTGAAAEAAHAAASSTASSDNDGCRTAFSFANVSFYSECECADVPTVTVGTCSLSGYSFEKGRDGATPFAPAFPASSPWVTSVGATQVAWDLEGSCLQSDLLGPDNAHSAETAVNKFTGGFDGGGGFSTEFTAPQYQTAHLEAYVGTDAAPPADTFNSSNRGFPDVSAAGHNFVLVVQGKVQQAGGTSASAPAVAGMISLMNERLLAAGKSPLGFLNPALYKAAEESPSVFQAVIPRTYNLTGTSLEETLGPSHQVGSNKCNTYSCCELGYGGSEDGWWDPVTGLGTINYQALAEYLGVPASPPRPPPGPPNGGHDRHHAAYIAWIVVLVFGFASAILVLVYEHRPKLLLSATTLGRNMRKMGGGQGGGGGGGYDGYDGYEEEPGGWGGGSRGSGRRGRRPRGALTEMVMEGDIGMDDDSAYRLLEEDEEAEKHGDGGGGGGGGSSLMREGKGEEEGSSTRRSVGVDIVGEDDAAYRLLEEGTELHGNGGDKGNRDLRLEAREGREEVSRVTAYYLTGLGWLDVVRNAPWLVLVGLA